MIIHASSPFSFGHGSDFDTRRILTLPGDAVAHAENIITRNGRTTVGRQLVQAVVVLGFVSELAVLFMVLG